MITKLIGVIAVLMAFMTVGYAQSGGMNMVMLDGSVRVLNIQTDFPMATDPGNVRVKIGKLPATTLETCMASTDFSGAVKMNPRNYYAAYNPETRRMSFGFGVEREMKESGEVRSSSGSCQVVRMDGQTDGRDFLIWQRHPPSSALVDGILSPEDVLTLMQDGSVRFIKYSISDGF